MLYPTKVIIFLTAPQIHCLSKPIPKGNSVVFYHTRPNLSQSFKKIEKLVIIHLFEIMIVAVLESKFCRKCHQIKKHKNKTLMCVVLGLSWTNKLFLVCIIHWTCKMCWGDWIISVCLFYQLSLGKKNIFVTLLCMDHSSSVWSLMLPLLLHFLVMADDRGVFQSRRGAVGTVSFFFFFSFSFFFTFGSARLWTV